MSDEPMSYIARQACGCIVAAMVDRAEHRRDTARTVGQWIREGLTVERVTSQYVRKHLRSCPHEPKTQDAVQQLAF